MEPPSATTTPPLPPAAAASPTPPPPLGAAQQRWQWLLFFGALLLFATTRFCALDVFPSYFFCDEAIHSLCARDLIDRGFRAADGELLPAYFRNFFKYNLSLSVYVQGISDWFFGQSITTVRATAGALSLTSAAALALLLRRVFGLREWWLGAMLLAVTPAALVHSRTGFETALMVSCYGWFLCCYLLYRYRDPRWIFPAMAAGAGTFYAYSNGQGVMAISGVLLLLSDARYHWRQRGWAAGGLGFALLLFVPYLRFRHGHPDFLAEHFRDLGGYVISARPFAEKARIFLGNYAYGLSPKYWFFPDQEGLLRHVAPGYGHFFLWLLPFFLLGVGLCLWRWRESRYRVLLIAMLAAPFSAALVEISICRVLSFTLPACAAIALGISVILERVRSRTPALMTRLGMFCLLAIAGFRLFVDCLAYGPTIDRDYGLFGLQWGAKELFRDALPVWVRRFPEARFFVSSQWANGMSVFIPFFGCPPDRVLLISPADALAGGWKGKDDDFLVVSAGELPAWQTGELFEKFEVVGRIARPDGFPGFYLGHLRRGSAWDAKLAELRRKQSDPVTEELQLGGSAVSVTHSPLDGAGVAALFDGNRETIVRCFQGVPLVVDLRFPTPRRLEGVQISHRDSRNFHQRVTAYAGDRLVCDQERGGDPTDSNPVVRVPLGEQPLDRLRIEVEFSPEGLVHLRDIELVEPPPAS